jgi:hypothetical protein
MLAAALLLSTTVGAQGSSPEAVAKAYLESFQSSDWKRAASLFTPDAQKQFRAMVSELFVIGPAETQAEVRKAFFGSELTAPEIAKLSDTEFLERFLKSTMARFVSSGAQARGAEIIGTVAERPNLVHVLTRSFSGGAASPGSEIEKMTVLSVEKRETGWGLSLSGELKGIVISTKARLMAATKSAESKK